MDGMEGEEWMRSRKAKGRRRRREWRPPLLPAPKVRGVSYLAVLCVIFVFVVEVFCRVQFCGTVGTRLGRFCSEIGQTELDRTGRSRVAFLLVAFRCRILANASRYSEGSDLVLSDVRVREC